MKTDSYTKVLLTVIAVCLLYLCALQSGARVQAQGNVQNVMNPLPAQPVIVVGYGRLDPKAPGGVAIAWADERAGVGDPVVPIRVVDDARSKPLRVDIENAPQLSVSVDSIRKGAIWDPVRTDVVRQPPQGKPGGVQ